MAKNAARNWSDTTLIQHHFAYLARNQAFAVELLFSLGNPHVSPRESELINEVSFSEIDFGSYPVADPTPGGRLPEHLPRERID